MNISIDSTVEKDILNLQARLRIPFVTPLILRYAIIEDRLDGSLVYPKGASKREYLHSCVMSRLENYALAYLVR